MRAGWMAFGLFLVSLAAQAQSPFNDPQRRAYVVPYVRKATDCLAMQLMAAPDLVDIVRSNRIRDALAGPFRSCADDIDGMIAAHDRAYFSGAGEQFFRGAYLADLPRAVQQRLKKEVERRDQEAAGIAAETSQNLAAAAERQKAADAQAARLWAENDRRQALSRQAQAAPVQPALPASNREIEFKSDPRTQVRSKAEDAAEQTISPLWYVFGVGVVYALFKWLYPIWRCERLRKRLEELRTARRAILLEKYGDQDIVNRIMEEEVWQGMSREQLIDSRGLPADIDTDVNAKRTRQIYKYDQSGADRFRRRVTLDDGVVVGFQERGL